MAIRKLGVEEEFLLVEPATGAATAVAAAVMQAAARRDAGSGPDSEPDNLDIELQKQQLEIKTQPCLSLDDLRREVTRCRLDAATAAGRAGAGLAALGTAPGRVQPSLSGDGRYQKMGEEFGLTAQEQLTCGCHVHVEVSSDEEGVAVLDRIQPWLAPLLALSANSPFWQGGDSSYASFRYQVWGRWPCAGPTAWFGSARSYADTVQAMIDTATVLDAGMVYFNARLSAGHPTIEVRIADVCMIPDDAVLVAALVRGLVETEARAWREDPAGRPVRPELLSLAAWRASRSGVEGALVHPVTGAPGPARQVIMALVDHVRPALAEAGDAGVVAELAEAVLARGNGAMMQRAVYRRAQSVRDVVQAALERTGPG